MIADKEGPGSSTPKRREKTFKWAVLLTGINSVSPWIKPYKINFKYSKILLNFLIYYKNNELINSNLENTIYIK